MSLSHLSLPHLRKAAPLIKKKETFLAKIQEIEQELEALAVYGVFPKTYRDVVQAKPAKRPRKNKAKTKAKVESPKKPAAPAKPSAAAKKP